MHEQAFVARKALAQEKIVAGAAALAAQQGVNFDVNRLTVTHRDPQIQALFRLEAVAELLGVLSGATSAPVAEDEAKGKRKK